MICQHWFVHQHVCREDPQPIVQDDGAPDWVDVATYEPRRGGDDLDDDVSAIWAEVQGSDIFIDIPNISKYRPHEVYRIRTRTLSPALLRSYARLWALSEPARVAMSTGKFQLRARVIRDLLALRRIADCTTKSCCSGC